MNSIYYAIFYTYYVSYSLARQAVRQAGRQAVRQADREILLRIQIDMQLMTRHKIPDEGEDDETVQTKLVQHDQTDTIIQTASKSNKKKKKKKGQFLYHALSWQN